MAKNDIKKETGIETQGSQTKDRVAYKQCVEQQKRMGSSNPWAMCNAQFGIGKAEAVAEGLDKSGEIQPGQSYSKMKKKEAGHMRTDRSSAKKIMAAEKEHMKPSHPQVGMTLKPNKVHIKHPVMKSEIEPRMSWAQLQKMQSEQPLQKENTISIWHPQKLKEGSVVEHNGKTHKVVHQESHPRDSANFKNRYYTRLLPVKKEK